MTAPSANGTATAVDAAVATLLNFAEPLDVALLDNTVNAFYGAGSSDQVSGGCMFFLCSSPRCTACRPACDGLVTYN